MSAMTYDSKTYLMPVRNMEKLIRAGPFFECQGANRHGDAILKFTCDQRAEDMAHDYPELELSEVPRR